MTEVAYFSPHVILLEYAFMREMLGITRSYLQKKGRDCPVLDMAHWLSILAIDGGFTLEIEEKKEFEEIQVIIVREQQEEPLEGCLPQDIAEMDAKRVMTLSGPMHFNVVQASGMFPAKDLFFDLMDWVISAPEVKRVMLMPCMDTEDDMPSALREVQQRMRLDRDANFGHVTWVHMGKIDDVEFCNHAQVFFSIMMSMGIALEELR